MFYFKGAAQTQITMDFPLDPNLWEIGGDASTVDFDGINDEDEILLTPYGDSQNGYIKYRDFINFAKCGKWVVDFEFRLWSEFPNSSGDGFAFTLLNQYEQGEGGSNLGIPQTLSSLGLVVAFDTYDNCNAKTYDNPEIQISEIDVYHGYNYTENCGGLSNPRTAKLGTGNYEKDILLLRSPNYRPARIIYDNKNLSVFVDINNDGTLDEVLRPTYLNLDYYYGMQMAFTASTGTFADNQSIKNIKISIENKNIETEKTVLKCPGIDLELEGGIQFQSYTWKNEMGEIIGTEQNLLVSEAGLYTLEKEFLCGIESEKITVLENDLAIESVSTTTKCGYVELVVEASGGERDYRYSIIDVATSQIFNTFKIYKSGEFVVQVKDANECAVQKKVRIDFVPDQLFASAFQSSGNEVTMNVTGGSPPYQYQFDNRGFTNSNVQQVSGPGEFTYDIKDSLGCMVSAKIEIECDPFEIPNYFSPNNDGINDIWFPEGLTCYPDFEAQIFDRQGRILYQFKGENSEGWDGTYNGNPLPSTDYWYTIRLNLFKTPLTGHFNLYR